MAAEWAGFTTVGQCEFADYPTKVLEKHWPDVPRWRDVRDVTAEAIRDRGIREITLLSGGFPCQPHSLTGKRQASADERDLWGEFARIICETKPRWVLGENVPGLFTSESGRFFGNIFRDLSQMGYYAGWCCYGASDVGAPHKRERIFIMANSFGKGWKRRGFLFRTEASNATHGNSNQNKIWDTSVGENAIKSMLHGVANELPYRLDRNRCLGNAVVPAQVYPILQAIADIEVMK